MCQNITAHRVNGGSSLANTLFFSMFAVCIIIFACDFFFSKEY